MCLVSSMLFAKLTNSNSFLFSGTNRSKVATGLVRAFEASQTDSLTLLCMHPSQRLFQQLSSPFYAGFSCFVYKEMSPFHNFCFPSLVDGRRLLNL